MIGPLVRDDQDRLFLMLDAHPPFGFLRRLQHLHRPGSSARLQPSKVFLGQFADFLWINVARDPNRDVGRHIILAKERVRLRHAKVLNVFGEPSRRDPIRMQIEGSHQQLLD